MWEKVMWEKVTSPDLFIRTRLFTTILTPVPAGLPILGLGLVMAGAGRV
jgi:hypothetical protein